MKAFVARVGPALAALLAGAVVVAATHASPLSAYAALAQGAFGSLQGISETLAQTTVFIFAGAGVAIAFRAGLFNIGAEGQLIVGALCTAVAGVHLHLPAPIEVLACAAAGAAGGALWASIAGVLRARYGASEVITTIMLNYIAALGVNFLVAGPLRGSEYAPETATIDPAAMLAPLIPATRLTLAFPLAVVIAVALWWWLGRSVAGFELRAVGSSERVARYAGISVPGAIVRAMALSGALAGLGGACEVLGLFHRFNAQLSPGYGFTSIAVALLAQSSPLGVVASGLFFGALQNGALSMQVQAGISKDLISIIEGLIILFISVRWIGVRLGVRHGTGAPAQPAEQPV
jgi:simple sugar transport system permease protein